MPKLFAFVLAAACQAAAAQTPTVNPMPDGSRDMYVGLGAVSAPDYAGAAARRTRALPVLQAQWSNGLFVSGMSAGWHLAQGGGVEYGPLLQYQPRRSDSGTAGGVGGVTGLGGGGNSFKVPTLVAPRGANGPLSGMDELHPRLLAGGFVNVYLRPEWRVTADLLAGSGNDGHGARIDLGVQRLAIALGAHHGVSLAAGVVVASRSDNQTYFGVTDAEAARSINAPFDARAGVRAVHAGARWNWALTPSWMLTSSVQYTQLVGSAADSPLVQRAGAATVTSALALRF